MSDTEFLPTAPVPTPLEEPFEPELDERAAVEDVETASKASPRATISKSAARKIIDKYLEISRAPKRQVQILASSLGVKNDPADIAAIISTSNRNPLIALSELETVTSAGSPFDAVVAAFALDRDEAKRVWALLSQLGHATGNLPAKESTAAAKIAEAASELTDADRQDLDLVRALGRK